MIARLWFVKAEGDGYVAREWKQGHDGRQMVTPAYTGRVIRSTNLEGLRDKLRAENVSSERTDRVLEERQKDHPDTLEVWW